MSEPLSLDPSMRASVGTPPHRPRFAHLQLLPFPPESEAFDDLSSLARLEELFVLYGWKGLNQEQRQALVSHLSAVWKDLTPYRKNCLVTEAMGSKINGSAVPLWSTADALSRLLYQRVQQDLFPADAFSDILYMRLVQKAALPEDTGLPLLDPHLRAFHYLTLRIEEGPDDVSFAFVVIYTPRALFHVSAKQTAPLTPLPDMVTLAGE